MKMYVYGVLLVFYFVINKRNLLFTFEHRRSAHSELGGGGAGPPVFYESKDSLILIDEILLLYNFLSYLSPKFYFTRFGPPPQFYFSRYACGDYLIPYCPEYAV